MLINILTFRGVIRYFVGINRYTGLMEKLQDNIEYVVNVIKKKKADVINKWDRWIYE